MKNFKMNKLSLRNLSMIGVLLAALTTIGCKNDGGGADPFADGLPSLSPDLGEIPIDQLPPIEDLAPVLEAIEDVVKEIPKEVAEDEFKFIAELGICQNDEGEEGLNDSIGGQCSDGKDKDVANQDLRDVDLSGSNFDNSRFENIDLTGANLTNVSIKDSEIVNVTLENTKLEGINMEGTVIDNSVIKDPRVIEQLQETNVEVTDNNTLPDGFVIANNEIVDTNDSEEVAQAKSDLRTKIKEHRQEISLLRSQKEGPRNEVLSRRDRRREIVKIIHEHRAKIKEAQAGIEPLKAEIRGLRDEIRANNAIAKEFSTKIQELHKSLVGEDDATVKADIRAKMADLRLKRKEVRTVNKEINAQRKEIRAEINKKREPILAARDEIKGMRSKIKAIKNEALPFREKLKELNAEIRGHRDEIRELRADIKALNEA